VPLVPGAPPAAPFEIPHVGSSPGVSTTLPISSGLVKILTLGDAIQWADAMLGSQGTENDYRYTKLGLSSVTLFIYCSGGSALVTFALGVAGPARNYITAVEPVASYQAVQSRFIDKDHGFS
jgi:hypothetical protein